MWDCITYLISEIKRCEKADATTAALSMSFICIDVMSYLSMPADKPKQGRTDFISWVDTYLEGHDDQPYAYRGIDVYGARCALLHVFGSEVDFHQQNSEAKKFGYHNGGKHAYDFNIDPGLVIIGAKSFVNDVVAAVVKFIETVQADENLKLIVESRLSTVLALFPVQPQSEVNCSFLSRFSSWKS